MFTKIFPIVTKFICAKWNELNPGYIIQLISYPLANNFIDIGGVLKLGVPTLNAVASLDFASEKVSCLIYC